MRTVTGYQSTPSELRSAVIAIGNFDGVHRGHQALLARAMAAAEARPGAARRPAGVMIFEPHPRSYFRPDVPLFRLTPIERKLELFAALGLDVVVVLGFDRALASLAADQFIREVLVDGLGVAGVVIGPDFQFGRQRGGDAAMLRAAGEGAGFIVEVVEPVLNAGLPVSSSRVRERLAAGDVAGANDLLGHRWRISGTVTGGARLGRAFGFPTANIEVPAGTGLAHGIYAVRVRAEGRWWDGAGYYGSRPSVDGGPPRLEVFLFGFDADLYDRRIDVELAGFIREDRKFDSFDALTAQMGEDCARAAEQLAAIRASDPLAGLPLADGWDKG